MVGCISVLITSYFHPSSVKISILDVSKYIHQYVCGADLFFENDFFLFQEVSLIIVDYFCIYPETGHDSSVGIATRYGLDSPGIESQWVASFPHPFQSGLGAHPASYTMGTASLSRG